MTDLRASRKCREDRVVFRNIPTTKFYFTHQQYL